MKSSKLISNLKILNKAELRRFKKFVTARYHTENDSIPNLLLILSHCHPGYDHPSLEKTKVFAKLYPDRIYNANVMRILMKDLLRQLKDFFVDIFIRGSYSTRQNILLDFYKERGAVKEFEITSSAILRVLDKSPLQDKHYYSQRKIILEQLCHHPGVRKTDEVHRLQSELMQHLDLEYIFNKMALKCNMLSTSNFLRTEKEQIIVNVLDQAPVQSYIEKHALLNLYAKLLKMLEDKTPRSYFEYRDQFNIVKQDLRIEDRRDMLFHLLNFAISASNKGDAIFSREVFELYKIGLRDGIIIEDGKMSDITFTNIIALAVKMEEIKWVEAFIKDYEETLPKDKKADALDISSALIAFYHKKYVEVVEGQLNYNHTQVAHQKRSKSLLLRSYFELFLSNRSYSGLLLSYLHSYEAYFRRDQVNTKERAQLYIRLISKLRKLVKLINENKWTDYQRKKMKREIKKEDMILKGWLLDKVEGL